ncbi:centromere protein T isoform X1 [Antechinus flavipes]|uniref:centromere protein T isoform X1 n=2 Tax=Antechinus flavipes TaxID=38775 RepID=UPI002236009D|nr:centromere protein T isoform X1 [Antechinus flavipes]XP_051830940.1 centromere protein T isoform X1 [Antechinus flavipes]XP_051830941.1 centromere protein T isoform X1 [Antechinus flavipes]
MSVTHPEDIPAHGISHPGDFIPVNNMEFLSENEGTKTLLHHVLEMQPLSSPVSSNTRLSKRSLSLPTNHPCRNLRASLPNSLPSKQTKPAPAQQKDIGANGQLFDFLEEGTPRFLLKKILQTASEASVLVPALVNSQEPEPVELQEESKSFSLELQLPESESSVTVAPEFLVQSRKKRCLSVSEFEQEVDQGLAVASENLTGKQPALANKSPVTRSFNLTLATILPPESVERPGLARRPPTRKTVDIKAFEQRLKAVPLTHLLDHHAYHSVTSVDSNGSFQASRDSVGFRRNLAEGPDLRAVTKQADQGTEKGVRRQTKSYTKSPSQNTPISASPMSTGTRTRPWVGTPRQNSRLSARSAPARSSISRSARAKSGEEEGVRLMEEETATESGENTEVPERTEDSELSMRTPEFLRAKRHHFLSQPPNPVLSITPTPPNTTTPLLPSKFPRARRAPKRRAPGPRQPRDPDKTGLNNYCKVFSYYAKLPMEKPASQTLMRCLDQYFRTLCDDLETFAHHAGRKTVLLADLELLMRRQGLVTDEVSLYVLVERYLPLEYRRLLIPCAASGNSVFPAG